MISGIYCTNSNSFENISWLKCYCLISEFHTEFRADVKVSLRQSLCWETQSKLVITFRQNVPNISFPSSGFSEWLSLWLVGLWQDVVLLGGGFWLIIRPKIQERENGSCKLRALRGPDLQRNWKHTTHRNRRTLYT